MDTSSFPLLVEREGTDTEERLIDLLNQYERPLYSYLLTMVSDRELAQDCTQNTFLRAYEHMRGGKSVNNAWLYRVAHNRAMDEFRRRRRLQPGDDAFHDVPAPQPSLEVVHMPSKCSEAITSEPARSSYDRFHIEG